MKTFKRTSLVDTINHNGQEFTPNIALTGAMSANRTPLGHIDRELKLQGRRAICVEVLVNNLKGKLDLHGNPYKPTKWIYTTN